LVDVQRRLGGVGAQARERRLWPRVQRKGVRRDAQVARPRHRSRKVGAGQARGRRVGAVEPRGDVLLVFWGRVLAAAAARV
jgi:hypothetical protein